jgi:hypothetical protein
MTVEFVKSTRGKALRAAGFLPNLVAEARSEGDVDVAQAEEGMPLARTTFSFPQAHFSTARAAEKSPPS